MLSCVHNYGAVFARHIVIFVSLVSRNVYDVSRSHTFIN